MPQHHECHLPGRTNSDCLLAASYFLRALAELSLCQLPLSDRACHLTRRPSPYLRLRFEDFIEPLALSPEVISSTLFDTMSGDFSRLVLTILAIVPGRVWNSKDTASFKFCLRVKESKRSLRSCQALPTDSNPIRRCTAMRAAQRLRESLIRSVVLMAWC